MEGHAAANRAIELDRTDHLGYTARGVLHALAGGTVRTNQAVEDTRRGHELNPNDFLALHMLGFMEMLHGEHDVAISHLLQALRLNPLDPLRFSVHALLADALFFRGDYARGLEFGLQAVAAARGGGTTWHDVALCHVGLHELDKAREALGKARKSAPEFVEAALSGRSLLRRPQDRLKYQLFLRVAAGLEDPKAADALR